MDQEKIDNLKIANLKLRLENARLKNRLKNIEAHNRDLQAQLVASMKFLSGGKL